MMDQGAPINLEWNQAILFADVWVIPRGAKNITNALRFLQFAGRAQNQAAFAAIYPSPPANRAAYRLLTQSQAARLPDPANVVIQNAEWWAQRDASGKSNTEKLKERWRRWILEK
jgi:putative spermidine/putrescine transport system substrate-binding protein